MGMGEWSEMNGGLGFHFSKLNYLSSKIFKLGFINPDQSTSPNEKWWSESPLITLSEEDIKYCYVFNNIIFRFTEVRLQFFVIFNFFLSSSNFRPKTARDLLDS